MEIQQNVLWKCSCMKIKMILQKKIRSILAFLLHDIRLQKIRPLWWTTTYISPKAKTIQSSVLTHFTSGVTNVTVRIDIKNKTKKEFKLNLQTGVCTWFDLWSSQVTMGSNPVWTCISIHFSGTLFKKLSLYLRIIWFRSLSDLEKGLKSVSNTSNRKYIIRQLIIRLKYMICSLTEHGIVLSKTEQFDVLDLYRTRTKDVYWFVLFWVRSPWVNWWKNTLVWLKYTCTRVLTWTFEHKG